MYFDKYFTTAHHCSSPPVDLTLTVFTQPSPDDTQAVSGSLSQSVFHWRKPQVLTATAAGSLVVWDVVEDLTVNQSLPKDRMKFIPLQKHPITALTVTDR